MLRSIWLISHAIFSCSLVLKLKVYDFRLFTGHTTLLSSKLYVAGTFFHATHQVNNFQIVFLSFQIIIISIFNYNILCLLLLHNGTRLPCPLPCAFSSSYDHQWTFSKPYLTARQSLLILAWFLQYVHSPSITTSLLLNLNPNLLCYLFETYRYRTNTQTNKSNNNIIR